MTAGQNKALGAWLMLLTLLSPGVASAQERPIPTYERVTGVAGSLSSVGSDTLANLMALWAESFRRHYLAMNIQIQAAGSSTAPPALIEGTANFGPMSRPMKDGELAAFEKRYGYKPTAVPAAVDVLAVFVHKDNPLEGLSLSQLDAIFSSTRRCGAGNDLSRWGQLPDMPHSWRWRRIQLFGRNSVSGTYGYFKKQALCKGDYKDNVNEQPGSASVVQSVSASLNAIGYSGIGYRTSGVRALPLSRTENTPFVEARTESAFDGSYPLARLLYIYVNAHPNKPLPPLEREFLRLVLSTEGQAAVEKDGYIPLPPKLLWDTRERLGI